MAKKEPQKKRLQVNIELEGEWADRFLHYKEEEFFPTNSSAGRKLIVERLMEREKRQAEPTTA
jgi:hypothetical protein